MATQPSDAQRFVFAVRNVVGRAETKHNFIVDTVSKAKDLQRTAQQEYEAHLLILFKALDLYQLTGGSPSEMHCALTTIEILLQLPLSSSQLFQCNSSIRVCLLSAGDVATMLEAARVLGLSIATSGPNDSVRKACDDSMIWIGLTDARSEARRMGGLAIVDEVLQRVPVLFLKYLSDFFDRIWGPLSDPTTEVRDFAIHVFDRAMKLLSTRDADSRLTTFSQIKLKVRSMLQSKNIEQNIGALSVLDSFVAGLPVDTKQQAAAAYDDLVTMLQPLFVVSSGTNCNPKVRQLLFHAYSALCKFNTVSFSNKDLKNAVNYGLEFTKKEVERPYAFRMLRDVITLVRTDAFMPYQGQTILAIKQVILNQKRQGKPPVWESLECLATICKVCPSSEVEAHVKSCIEHIFSYGLSTQLIDCMRDIVAASSTMARLSLEESMLDLISITLCGLPFRQQQGGSKSSIDGLITAATEPTEEQIVIALDAFLKFGFSNSEQLGDFLRDSVLPFVDSDKMSIRCAAIKTIATLLLPTESSAPTSPGSASANTLLPTSSSSQAMIAGTQHNLVAAQSVLECLTFSRRMCVDFVLSRLLVIGTSDNEPSIRGLVLSSLNAASYFPFLCEPQFLTLVCTALGDEDASCRLAAIDLICGMLPCSPSLLLPLLRREMVKVLQTLSSTERPQYIEQGLRCLSRIARGAPLFVRPFFNNILQVLVPRYRVVTARDVTFQPLLEALVTVSHSNMFAKRHSLADAFESAFSPLISKTLEVLQSIPMDTKSKQQLRLLCIQLLTGLLRPSFDGVSPYQHFPALYHTLSSIVRNKDECADCRLESLRCLGKIGALDPHKFAELEIAEGIATSQSGGTGSAGPLKEKMCTTIVLEALAVALAPRSARVAAGGSEPLLRTTLKTALMISERSSACSEIATLFQPLCGLILDLPRQSRIFYTALHELGNLISVCGRRSLKEAHHFRALIRSVWETPRARFLIVRLCSMLVEVAKHNFDSQSEIALRDNLGLLLPKILDELVASEQLSYNIAAMNFILQHCQAATSLTQRICFALLELLQSSHWSVDHAGHVLVVLTKVATVSANRDLVPPLVRGCLAKLTTFVTTTVPVPSESNPFVAKALGLLRTLASEKYLEFVPFAADVLRSLKTLRLNNQELTFLCTQACRGSQTCPPALMQRSKQDLDAHVNVLLETTFLQSYAAALAEVGEIWGDTKTQPGLANLSETFANPDAAVAAPDALLVIGEARIVNKSTKVTTLQTKDDWLRWYDEFCKVLIAEAPYHVFRCVSASQGVNSASLVEKLPDFVQDIVNVAFRSIHTNGSFHLKTVLSDMIQKIAAMGGQSIPDDVVVGLLGIAEHMDMCGFALPVPHLQLAELAQNKGMLAKSLYWQEQGYRTTAVNHSKESSQSLIATYASLGHVDSAAGLLHAEETTKHEPSVHTSGQSLSHHHHVRASSVGVVPEFGIVIGALGGASSPKAFQGDGGVHNNSVANNSSSDLMGLDWQDHGSPTAQTSYQQQQVLMRLGKFEEALEMMNKHSMMASPNGNMSLQLSMFDGDSIFKNSYGVASPTPHRSRHTRTRSYSTVSDSADPYPLPQDTELTRKVEADGGKIWCLSEVGDMQGTLSEWRLLLPHLRSLRQQNNGEEEENTIQCMIAPFVADAAVRLNSWEDLSDALTWVPKDSLTFGTSTAALQISQRALGSAKESITQARELLLEEITGLLHESYARAYDHIVSAQQLVEFEEIIGTLGVTEPLHRAQQSDDVSLLWQERICSSAHSVSSWKRMMGHRGLLIHPSKDISTQILFVKLCREYGGSRRLERFTLEQMLGSSSPSYDQLIDPSMNPRVVFEYITYLSSCGQLSKYASHGDERSILEKLIEIHGGVPENKTLEARMHLRRGIAADPATAAECYKLATDCDPTWFRAWRSWADANVLYLEGNANHQKTDEPFMNAIDGFVKAIELAPTTSNKLQDVLKLLSLWAKHANSPKRLSELERRVFDVSLSVWQLVIPQLIARLDSGSDECCALVAKVICAVAMQHPQSLIYPLNVCTASSIKRRKLWANDILAKMQSRFPQLVAQGTMVTTELIRIAALIHEQWHEALEGAASAFFGRRDNVEMLEAVLPAHEKLKKAPETIVEVQFFTKFHRQLEEARHWVRSFSLTGKTADLHSAWHIYHAIYKQIDEQLKSGSTLSMQYCSPRLWEAKNLALAIPDARPKEGKETVRIAAFDSKLTVIASKQRPKRIAFLGTDGAPHKFLLKGHEDLRLDERVMQLFKLVNTLLLSNARTSKEAGFQIQRYSVTPLWDTVGLIGWVDECDTIHELIHSYRRERDITPELELKIMHNILPTEYQKVYDFLPVMSKIEVLEYLWDHTSGQDIRKAMWASSLTCETWLERRRTFTSSLATMSVVGYILGLGDRHPNNIMIQRSTGRVVHIDFGDCFEVAMTRDRFPEKIPFRLTRMLQNAMEVSGVDGNFRSSAETVMTALRDNKDSLITMLAAFVQDPLISWRLVKRTGNEMLMSNDANKAIDESHLEVAIGEEADEVVDSPLMTLVPFSEDDDLAALEMTRRQRAETSAAEEDRKASEEEVAHQGVAILNRLASKLRGQEFGYSKKLNNGRGGRRSLDPKSQVSKLITEATEISNIAQSWSGWYPFW
ncbi:phosphatidylinositol 3-kinase, putative [Bodo saltans]|uniref:Serine/threonine-protein kinase TOR n=1 Tax=Bodo saltans TaxID=75058 RepID=A0A0S4IRQ6_BODSA|nr:phosphatidylinositol 3-kinase, putative [Bodo saltans]|eukprot:CUF10682.1 phosphatidylinositol 3-kinase, putative [Bodo saltans]